jgi:tRNA (guanine37-N1)-methyltransferase
MVENIRINKAQNVIEPFMGDVREIAKTLPKCDRILMPLPKGAETFLDAAFDSIKSNGIIHYFTFGDMNDPFSAAEANAFLIAKKCNKRIMIVNSRVVRPFSPSKVQVVFDIQVLD